tara:strand:+ start:1126 stop:2055 length:930 start_codon:yes stop_codon:yes gene_type:complete
MGVVKQYYMNGTSFATATSLYLDVDLTTCAPDGFYSWNGVARELIDCVLSPLIDCPDCIQTCGAEPISVWNMADGIYNTEFTASDSVGAVVVEITPGITCLGVKVDYNGTTYNNLSSKTEGALVSTNTTRPTYIGLASALFGPFSRTLDVFEYEQGAYTDTGNNVATAQLAGDDNRTTNHPGKCILIVPKISTTADPIVVDIETMEQGNVGYSLKVGCPQLLTTFNCSLNQTNVTDACTNGDQNAQFRYHYPINGTAGVFGIPGQVGLYDFVFSDPYGALPLSAGFYRLDLDYVAEVVDGIVIDIHACN